MLINKSIYPLKSHLNPTTLSHLVDLSPWPMTSSISVFTLAIGIAMTNNKFLGGGYLICLGFFFLVLSAACWWRDVIREGYQGRHTETVIRGLNLGFGLFVVSEIFLFLAFFWALLHSSLSPNIELGCSWPPVGIEPIDPWVVPLLNAIVLLSSGVSVTWAHHSIIKGDYNLSIKTLLITIILAIVFIALMVMEYFTATYTIADSVYGSCFYMLTGLHGLHMIVGVIFLTIGLYRLSNYHFSAFSFEGLNLSIVYYHFVDVVFLFVFTICYWWSSGANFM